MMVILEKTLLFWRQPNVLLSFVSCFKNEDTRLNFINNRKLRFGVLFSRFLTTTIPNIKNLRIVRSATATLQIALSKPFRLSIVLFLIVISKMLKSTMSRCVVFGSINAILPMSILP